jgi:hypothetical protein
MSIFQKVTPEEEEQVIQKAYEEIKKRKFHVGALLILRGFSLFAPIGGALGRFFLGPVTPFMGHREEKIIWTLEKPENLLKLTKMLEEDEEKQRP